MGARLKILPHCRQYTIGLMVIAVTATIASFIGAAHADIEIEHAEPFASAAIYTKAELSKMKGGFVSAKGLKFDVGATVRTFIDGVMVLESEVILVGPGAEKPMSISSQEIGAMPGLTVIAQGASSEARPASLAAFGLSNVQGLGGVVLERGDGDVAVALHRLTGGTMLNFVAASGTVGSIEQRLDIDIVVRNFGMFQEASRAAAWANHLLNTRP